jgi:alkylhydroperoxidase family enzyme
VTGVATGWDNLPADAAASLAPDAVQAFEHVVSAVVASRSVVVELARRRVGTLLGLADDTLPAVAEVDAAQAAELGAWPTAAAYSPAERATLGFAEQFVMDVSAVTDRDRTALTAALGVETFGFVQALYVVDHVARLSTALEQMLGATPLATPNASSLQTWPAIEAMMTAVARLSAVDQLTAELVRLRGARAHHCRLCCSRRRLAAATANPDLLERPDVEHHPDLTPAQHAALNLTDAILLHPADLSAPVVEAVRAHLTPQQAAEVALLVAHNAANKIAVALGADAPNVTDGVEYFDVDAAGDYAYGLAAP